jgi:hypothetical protein
MSAKSFYRWAKLGPGKKGVINRKSWRMRDYGNSQRVIS